jgi:hypothetical protein
VFFLWFVSFRQRFRPSGYALIQVRGKKLSYTLKNATTDKQTAWSTLLIRAHKTNDTLRNTLFILLIKTFLPERLQLKF